jgi:hypothetical protein
VYQFGKLDAFQQFHVARRLGAVTSGLGEGIVQLQAGGGAAKLADSGGIMRVVQPLLEAIGRMQDSDANYVMHTCLSVVKRKQGATSWASVQTAPGYLMFPDIEMTCMIALVYRVLEFNLGGFFSELLSALPASGTEQKA